MLKGTDEVASSCKELVFCQPSIDEFGQCFQGTFECCVVGGRVDNVEQGLQKRGPFVWEVGTGDLANDRCRESLEVDRTGASRGDRDVEDLLTDS